MSIGELANTPITITLCNKEYKIKRLSIGEFFGLAEAKIKENRLKTALEIAKNLEGKEKMEFLMNVQNSTPKGSDLNEESMNYLNQPDGIAMILQVAFNKLQVVSEDEITNIILNAEQSELQYVLSYIIGTPDKVKDKVEDNIDKKK